MVPVGIRWPFPLPAPVGIIALFWPFPLLDNEKKWIINNICQPTERVKHVDFVTRYKQIHDKLSILWIPEDPLKDKYALEIDSVLKKK